MELLKNIANPKSPLIELLDKEGNHYCIDKTEDWNGEFWNANIFENKDCLSLKREGEHLVEVPICEVIKWNGETQQGDLLGYTLGTQTIIKEA